MGRKMVVFSLNEVDVQDTAQQMLGRRLTPNEFHRLAEKFEIPNWQDYMELAIESVVGREEVAKARKGR